jgi:steroid delta-isomerase-like uncharacterized protein
METTANNKSVVNHFVDAFNRGDMDAAAGCFSDDACNFGRPVGRAGVRRVLKDILKTFPDVKLEPIDTVIDGAWVVERGHFSGTHRGVGELPVNGGLLVGVPATNKPFQVHHIHMYRLSDGKIVDHYANRDDIGMMQQLGLLPPSPPMPRAPSQEK